MPLFKRKYRCVFNVKHTDKSLQHVSSSGDLLRWSGEDSWPCCLLSIPADPGEEGAEEALGLWGDGTDFLTASRWERHGADTRTDKSVNHECQALSQRFSLLKVLLF